MIGATWLVWTWPFRPVAVTTCGLCGAVLTADGAGAHERWHAATTNEKES